MRRTLEISVRGRGLIDVTGRVREAVRDSGVREGLCVAFVMHTSASLLIQENAAPSAAADLLAWLARLAPDGDPRYTHAEEGPDDMPAHLRSSMLRTSETLIVSGGELLLGVWQGLFLVEHREGARVRRVELKILGDG